MQKKASLEQNACCVAGELLVLPVVFAHKWPRKKVAIFVGFA